MYNGIGLTTPRGSGTNGFVIRNLSAVRQTKEKVPDYQTKEDSAVRPFDPELVEHERRRQAEVRCMELRDLLEEQELPEAEIEDKVNAFRTKLLAEKKLSYHLDSSGRPMVKDSHEFSVAQEQKNDRAKDAFGIRRDFLPGSSLGGKKGSGEMSTEPKEAVEVVESVPKTGTPPVPTKSTEKSKKRKKSHKRSKRSSSSGSSSSSDEESHRKKRKKEKKKKSKKSHRHRKSSESKSKSRNDRSSELEECSIVGDKLIEKGNEVPSPPPVCLSPDSSESVKEISNPPLSKHDSDESDEDVINAKYSLSIVDFSGHHKYYPSLPTKKSNIYDNSSAVEVIRKACLPLLANVSKSRSPIIDSNGNHEKYETICSNHGSRSRSSSSGSKYSSRSQSRSIRQQRQHSISLSRTPSRSPVSVCRSHRSVSSRSSSRSSDKSRSPSRSHRSRSLSKSRSHSRSSSSDSSRSRSSVSSKSKSRSRSRSDSSRSGYGSPMSDKSRSPKSNKSRVSPKSNRSRSPSIPRRRGSPSFMERRRITSARKRPIPYKRKDAVEWNVSSDSSESEN